MPFRIIRADITKLRADAIVDPTDIRFTAGGGADMAIHKAAGAEMDELCRRKGSIEPGEVFVTPGFDLPSGHVFHTVGPVWKGGTKGEEEHLAACYRICMEKAVEMELASIAFPLIASGTFGYPKDRATGTAVKEIGAFVMEHDLDVTLAVYDAQAFEVSRKLFSDVENYLGENLDFGSPGPDWERSGIKLRIEEALIESGAYKPRKREPERCVETSEADERPFPLPITVVRRKPEILFFGTEGQSLPESKTAPKARKKRKRSDETLEEALKKAAKADGFREMLFSFIDMRGEKDSTVYKRANITKQQFSKINSNPQYHPSKATALAFAFALELDLEGTEKLLQSAGYALSNASVRDVICRFFIEKGVFDVFSVNETLFQYDQELLGLKG